MRHNMYEIKMNSIFNIYEPKNNSKVCCGTIMIIVLS